ncbi:hypothetical protein EUX98_g7026 [Antrodiella citrinella]|uniref:RanBD1 domain-containing protein n=1 Tax=Antrodiella citrinella TaxID=2447956 RepID=A0A4V6S1S5_9APHY|nr:hypothetical protein EUX98_g7026 [Antrodiella citrinella]
MIEEDERDTPECVVPTPLSIPQAETSEQVTTSPLSPSKLQSTFTIPACKPSTAFSAFAGVSSGFNFASSSSSNQRPAWCAIEALPAAASVSAIDSTPQESESDALGTQIVVQPAGIAMLTGEEDEDVLAELKGVKLFIKRGSKDFTDGMLGHIKFLVDKKTGEERLVFRREPVWKVSMSVRLRPIVRCAFDEEHGVLRVTLKEKTVDEDGVSSEAFGDSVVIYALRRGKLSKSDFTDFAKRVTASSRLVTSSTV